MNFSEINYLAVGASALAAFALGALWYSPVLFVKAWQKEVGMSDEDFKNSNMLKTFGGSLIMMLIMAFGMGLLVQGHGGASVGAMAGMYHGLFVGIFFVGTSMAINMLYENRSMKLWLINSFYQIIFLGLMGLILGAWH